MTSNANAVGAEVETVYSRVRNMRFSYYTSAEIKRLSVCAVDSSTHVDALGHALRGGLYDARMGVVDARQLCATCSLTGIHCPGHIGRIELLLPAYQPMTFSALRSVLASKCFCCNRLRLPDLEIQRFVDIFDALERGDVSIALALLPLTPDHVVLRGFGLQELDNGLSAKYVKKSKKSVDLDGDNAKKRKRRNEDADEDVDDKIDSNNNPIDVDDNDDTDDDDDQDPTDLSERQQSIAAQGSAAVIAAANNATSPSSASSSTSSTETQSRIVHAVRNQVYNMVRGMMRVGRCANCKAFNPSIKQDSKRSKLFVVPLSAKFQERNKSANVALLPDFGVVGGAVPAAATPAGAAEVVEFDEAVESNDAADGDEQQQAPAGGADAEGGGRGFGMYMTPTVVREHMVALWSHRLDARLLDHLYGGGNSEEPTWAIFFLDCLAVPANRFRIMREEGNTMHAQDVIFTRVLKAQDRMRQVLAKKDDLGAAQLSAMIASSSLVVQDAVNDFFDKEADPRKASDPTGLRQLLERKEGMFRMFMMGKRVNHAARSVISPDVNLATNEVGLPLYFATRLTVREPVCGYNYDRLMRAVINGADQWPGANLVQFGDTETVALTSRALRADRDRRVGLARRLGSGTPSQPVYVHRHVTNNDFVLMNRQPTLHRPSILAHRIRVLRNGDKVLRIHYANCSSFNADFDGDEMNCHRPQDFLASAEAAQIVNADEQYCVPRDGTPVRGLIQDHISSGVLLTQKDTFLTRAQFHQLLWAGCAALEHDVDLVAERVGGSARVPRVRLPMPAIVRPRELWTGKQLIRCLLEQCAPGQPPITLRSTSRVKAAAWRGHSEEGTVIVHRNDLVTGVLDKNQFGASAFGLVHGVFEVYGGATAGRLLSSLGRLFSNFLQQHGFTCGISDLLLTPKAEAARAAALRDAAAAGIGTAASFVGLFDEQQQQRSGDASDPSYVALVSRQLRSLLSSSDAAAKALDSRMTSSLSKFTTAAIATCIPDGLMVPFPRNCMTLMTTTGAKGGQVNAAQISALLGSQELEGRRVPLMSSGKSLPCFEAYSPLPRAGGYVTDRFLTGIRPQEYFFHCVPEDHEILTDRGFMDLDAYESVMAREGEDALRVAGYDPATQQMRFETPRRLVKNERSEQTLVEFSAVGEMLDTWSAGAGDYGLQTPTDASSNHMSLLVTPGHDMFVQTDKQAAHRKVVASELLLLGNVQAVRHLAVAAGGVGGEIGAGEFSQALGLQSAAQEAAFLEVYGFWLATGSLEKHVALRFNQRTRADIDFLKSAIARTGLADTDWDHSRTLVRITNARWVGYFAAQYGHKYGDIADDVVADDAVFDDDAAAVDVVDDGAKRRRNDWTTLSAETNLPIVIDERSKPALASVGVVDSAGRPYDAVSWAGGSYMAPESSAKWFWHWVWTLDMERLRHIVRGLWRADGSWSDKQNQIVTASARFRDELVRVLLMAGYSARFALRSKQDAWSVLFAEPRGQGNDEAVCMPSTSQARGEVRERSYTGRTWCFVMPSGFIMTRRAHKNADGVVTKASRPIITGNCMAGREGLVDTAVKTSRSGYLQRCLIKHLENIVVSYDATVRDVADGGILQFIYGDDSLDIATGAATFIATEAAPNFEFYAANYAALSKRWAVDELLAQPAVRAVRDNVQRYDGGEPLTSVFAPSSNLSAVSERFAAALDSFVAKASASSQLRASDAVAGAAPTVEQFRNLMHVKYMRAVVPAGEAVGVLASQSIGEPSTQMTLNSVDYVTPLAIVWRSTKRAPPAPVDGPVGALIDALMAERRSAVQVQPDGVTEYLPLDAGEAIALSADERGRMRWTPLEAVTRHPVVNRDGSSTLMRVSLRSGRTVDVTRAKSILVVRDGRVVAVDGDELRVGDAVPVMHGTAKRPSGDDDVDDEVDTRTFVPVDGMPHSLRLTRAFGFFVGAYLAAGRIVAGHVSIASSVPAYRERAVEWPATTLGVTARKTSEQRVVFHSTVLCSLMTAMCDGDSGRRLPAFALRANRDFALGVLDGFLSNGRRQSTRSVMVRDGIATLLARFGEHSTLTQAVHKCRANNRATLRTSYGLVGAEAVDVLADVALDAVVSISNVEPTRDRVYDLTVAETRNMCTMSGVALADTFHLAGRGDLNVTLGIPRLREVLMAGGRNLETPSMRVALSNTKDRASAQQCARSLSRVLLVDVLHGITCVEKLYYDADAARWSRRYTLRLQLQSEAEHKDRCSRSSIVGALGARDSHNFVTHVLAAVYNELHSTRKLRMTRASGGDVGDDDGATNKRARRGDDGDGGDDDGDGGDGGGGGGGGGSRGGDGGDGEMLADANDDKDDEGGDDDESASMESDSSESGSSAASESRAKRARSGTDTDTDDGDDDNDGAEDELTTTDATNPADSSTSAHDPEGPSEADVDLSAIPDKYSAATAYLTSFHYSRQTNSATVVISTSLESKMLLLLTMAENAAQDTVVRQVAGIKRAVVVESKGGDFEVQTDGINLASTLRLSARIVDVRRLYCNDIHAVCGMFGIEAARNAIVRELGAVFGAYGINVDRRHINLVADALTRSGQYRAFNRGTFDDASSPIQQMTFETVARFLASAALSGLEDHVEGASARICVGLPIRNGTGLSDALLDVTALK